MPHFTVLATAVCLEGVPSQEELNEVAALLRLTWRESVDLVATMYPGLTIRERGEISDAQEIKERIFAIQPRAEAASTSAREAR